jgi:hypothetical protein
VPIVLKSGSLNLLEPSGLVQACNGIALPLPLPIGKIETDKEDRIVEEITYLLTYSMVHSPF